MARIELLKMKAAPSPAALSVEFRRGRPSQRETDRKSKQLQFEAEQCIGRPVEKVNHVSIDSVTPGWDNLHNHSLRITVRVCRGHGEDAVT